ncbi:hypothetical protein LCGC14_2515740, partial [marine sediment metagenome]
FQIGQLFNTPRADVWDGGDLTFDASSVGIAGEDQFGTIESTSGFLSRGVSRPLTAYGGDGGDIFSVYHNTAVIRLEGEAGNDEFIVRAFALVDPEEGDEQETSEIEGGAGDDLIQYAINAPVSIDGGAGTDTVVIIGTELPDNFVVTNEGITGAGLSVTFDNVEMAEVDGLEGDDNFFILSTSEGVVTTIIGGMGSDTFSVLGDVTETVVGGAQLEGEPGVITHTISTDDGQYSPIRVDGVLVTISEAAEGQTAVAITELGRTIVSEFGLTDTYSIQLLGTIPTEATILYLVVSAGVPSTTDQEEDPASDTLLVSTDGTTFNRAVVLTFNSLTNWSVPRTITVQAIEDSAAEGERVALISHSIISTDASLEAIALPDVQVTIVDDDKFGIIITESDGTTVVHEGGAIGVLASDTYTVELTHSLAGSDEVVVDLQHGADVNLSHGYPAYLAHVHQRRDPVHRQGHSAGRRRSGEYRAPENRTRHQHRPVDRFPV